MRAGEEGSPRPSDSEVGVAYAILKFAANPFQHISACGAKAMDPADPTRSMLRREVFRLGLAYVRHALTERIAGRRHAASAEAKSRPILY